MARAKQVIRALTYNVPRLKLCLVKEFARGAKTMVIRTPCEAANLLAPLRQASEEYFITLHLNTKHEVIGLHEVSHGTLSSSLVHPREVFKAALLANSFAILVCHNHPSGAKLTPSPEDLATTKQLLEAGEILGISLIDHLILGPHHHTSGDDTFFSFRESHPQLWNPE